MQSGTRRAYVAGLCGFVLVLLSSCKSTPKREESPANTALKPINVVVITLDTVRADHLHCYGNRNIQTPTIDGLAQQGVLFEKAVAQTPLTQPSHASIFTGTNPNVHNVRDTGGFALQPSSVTLATILQKHGWNTAAFVSASVLKKVFGFSQGFSVYDDQMPDAGNDNGVPVAVRKASLTVDRALAWLNNQQKQPFFIWVHFYDAHLPYNPPEEFRKQYPHNLYDAEIAYTDQQLGRLLGGIRKKSPADKTLIVLLADHGEGLGDHGEYEHGVFLYDSTVRIPWIMVGPGIPAGIRIQQQAREIDVLPTVLDFLGGKASPAVQGTSMLPTLNGKQVPSTYSYEETLYPKLSYGWSELRGIHTAHWMYVRAPKPELYDLHTDPGELNNVIDAHPKEYRELEQQLKSASRLGNKETETVVANQMDQKTTEQLRSLGYVGGSSSQDIQLNGKGADPKDRVDVLRALHVVTGQDAQKLSASQKIAKLRAVLAEDPTNLALYSDLADQYQAINQYPQALQTYLAAEQHGAANGMTYSHLGELYLRLGNLPQAVANFKQAAQLNPLDVQGQANLATAYVQMNQLDNAERAFRWVLTIQEFVPAYNGLGIIAMRRHNLPEARKNFERAVKLDPDYTEAQLNLGILCTQTDDFPCARTAFKAFLSQAHPADYKDMIPRVKYALLRMNSGR
ncbi:MAG TPA: sulfatase-like hydrolase/transferase [Acidobacteriaceae bacterium]|nr:sulfatase-like hydrolase/transferase [Acidobacteriaceae bacterium]